MALAETTSISFRNVRLIGYGYPKEGDLWLSLANEQILVRRGRSNYKHFLVVEDPRRFDPELPQTPGASSGPPLNARSIFRDLPFKEELFAEEGETPRRYKT